MRQYDQRRSVAAGTPPIDESTGILQRLELLGATRRKAVNGSNMYCQCLTWIDAHGRRLEHRNIEITLAIDKCVHVSPVKRSEAKGFLKDSVKPDCRHRRVGLG
jgi:hypothetical protein